MYFLHWAFWTLRKEGKSYFETILKEKNFSNKWYFVWYSSLVYFWTAFIQILKYYISISVRLQKKNFKLVKFNINLASKENIFFLLFYYRQKDQPAFEPGIMCAATLCHKNHSSYIHLATDPRTQANT